MLIHKMIALYVIHLISIYEKINQTVQELSFYKPTIFCVAFNGFEHPPLR